MRKGKTKMRRGNLLREIANDQRRRVRHKARVRDLKTYDHRKYDGSEA